MQQLQKTERKEYIDVARGIAIILMVLGHLGLKNSLTQIIYSFHMPLFFFIAGMTISRKQKLHVYLNKRITRLIVPYLLFAFIFSTPDFKAWIYVLYGSRNSIRLAGSSTPLWFLPCLFCADIIFQMVLRLHKNGGGTSKHILIVTNTIILAIVGMMLQKLDLTKELGLPFSLNVALLSLPFICCGWIIKEISIIESKSRTCLNSIGLAATLLVIVLYQFNLPESLTQGFNHIELSIGAIGNAPMFYLCAFAGSFAVISISCSIKKCYILSQMGKSTLTCLGIHGVVIRILRAAGSYFGWNIIAVGLLSLTAAVLFTLVLNPVLKRYIPNIIGLNKT